MSVTIGTKLRDKLENFSEFAMPDLKNKEEKISCFMNTLEGRTRPPDGNL